MRRSKAVIHIAAKNEKLPRACFVNVKYIFNIKKNQSTNVARYFFYLTS